MWRELLQRPSIDSSGLFERTTEVLDEIRVNKDQAVSKYSKQFDGVSLDSFIVNPVEFEEAEALVSSELKNAIIRAKNNISTFHSAQQLELPDIETEEGIHCWQKALPIEKVGLYIPGGTAPLFSTVLMLAVPARIAGCKEIILCTPPNKEGNIHPAILYAAKVAGVNKVFKVGGIQAIGAMAYGTETIPKTYKIFGPGNQYVTAAKQIVSLKDVAIDMPAGPSEVAIIADETANAAVVVADMLSQAEHGRDSQSIVFTTSEQLAKECLIEVIKQSALLPRKELIQSSLNNSCIFILKDIDEVVEMSNEYAPEHLIIMCKNYHAITERISNAGSVFLGHYTPESAGDYATGTNHTLPTSGYAKAYSGVNLDSFTKKVTYQELSKQGLANIASTIEIMAKEEQLYAHKHAVSIRNRQ